MRRKAPDPAQEATKPFLTSCPPTATSGHQEWTKDKQLYTSGKTSDIITHTPDKREPFQDANQQNTQLQGIFCCIEVPEIINKRDQPDSLSPVPHSGNAASGLPIVNVSTWMDPAIHNGESVIFIHHPDEQRASRSLPAGSPLSNYWLLYYSIIQSLQTPQ